MNSKKVSVQNKKKQIAYLFQQNDRYVAFALNRTIITFSTYPRDALTNILQTIEKAGYDFVTKRSNPSIIREKDAKKEKNAFMVRVGKALFNVFNGNSWDPEIKFTYPAHFPEFTKRVYNETRKIPKGQVATYGEIAERIGSPGGARAVGNAMAKCPLGLIVPCHRVVKSNGRVGFLLAQEILEREGVQFRRRWVVQLPRD